MFESTTLIATAAAAAVVAADAVVDASFAATNGAVVFIVTLPQNHQLCQHENRALPGTPCFTRVDNAGFTLFHRF